MQPEQKKRFETSDEPAQSASKRIDIKGPSFSPVPVSGLLGTPNNTNAPTSGQAPSSSAWKPRFMQQRETQSADQGSTTGPEMKSGDGPPKSAIWTPSFKSRSSVIDYPDFSDEEDDVDKYPATQLELTGKAETKDEDLGDIDPGLPLAERKSVAEKEAVEILPSDQPGWMSPANKDITLRVLHEVQTQMKCKLSELTVSSSSGLSLTFISANVPFVLQHYLNPEAMSGVKLVFLKMRKYWTDKGDSASTEFKHLAEITDFDPTLRMAKMEKLLALADVYNLMPDVVSNEEGIPANELFGDPVRSKKLVTDVEAGIAALAKIGNLETGDERMSNVGIKPSTGDFALFDYNLSRPIRNRGDASARFAESRKPFETKYRK